MIKNIFKIKNKKGASGGLRKFMIALFLSVIFGFLILFFTASFLNNSNPSSDLLQKQYGLNSSANAFQSSIDNFTQTINSTQATLAASNPSPTSFLFLIFQGAFYIPLAFLQFIGSGLSSMGGFLIGSGGNGGILPLLVGAIISIITITGVLLIVKAIRTGETEY